MKIRMLIGMAGRGFSVAPREVTDRFEADEAGRLIAAGYAEEALDEIPEKSPEEWTAEVAALTEKLAAAGTDLDASAAREKALAAQLATATADIEAGKAREVERVAQLEVVTTELDASKIREDDLMTRLKGLETAAAPAPKTPEPAAKSVVEKAVKPPAAETRG